MYSSSLFFGRQGLLPMALSAVDNALWDIVGKHADRPVTQLVGVIPRDRIAVYQTGGSVAEGKGRGIRNFKRSAPVGPPLTAPSCTMAESFPEGSAILDAMSVAFDNGDFLAPTGPGFGSSLTEEMVLAHRLTA